MTETIMVAVEDSAASFAAARVALRLAADLGSGLLAVNVTDGGETAAVPMGPAARFDVRMTKDAGVRRARAGRAALDRVRSMALEEGVPVELLQVEGVSGEIASGLLAEADRAGVSMMVLARADSSRVGAPAIGEAARQVLEFAAVPVLLVPPPRPGPG